MNNELVIQLQESGKVAPSSTMIGSQFAIRVALVNHRSNRIDIDQLIQSTLDIGNTLFGLTNQT
jgi:hypothetical protein